MFLILAEGGHNHGECCRVLTNNLELPTLEDVFRKFCFEVKRWSLLKEMPKTLAIPWRSLSMKNSSSMYSERYFGPNAIYWKDKH